MMCCVISDELGLTYGGEWGNGQSLTYLREDPTHPLSCGGGGKLFEHVGRSQVAHHLNAELRGVD